MRNFRQLFAVLCVLSLVSVAGARKWTDVTGKFSVEAELVEIKGGNAILRKEDGTEVPVPLAKLSKADRDFIKAVEAEKKAPPPKAAEPAKPAEGPKIDLNPPEGLPENGDHWKTVASFKVSGFGDNKLFQSGLECWIWPANDQVLEPDDQRKIHLHFRCQVRPGENRPGKLCPTFVIFTPKTLTEVFNPTKPLESLDDILEYSLDVKDYSGTGAVSFFLSNGEIGTKRRICSNIIDVKCDFGRKK